MLKANQKIVLQFSKSNIFIKEWCGVNYAQEELGIFQISKCANGERKSAGGFIWKFKN